MSHAGDRPNDRVRSTLGRDTVSGATRVFMAEALIVPTGLATVAFLTRRLGPDGYGLYALAVTLVTWVEWTVATSLGRATISLVSGSPEWKRVGTQLLQAYLAMSLAVALALWIAAPSIATWLGAPELVGPVRLFCVDIPIMVMAYAHQSIITGLGRFTHRAVAIAVRWTSRLVLIVLFVEFGLSITGVILGSIGASLIEYVVSTQYDRPPLLGRAILPLAVIRRYVAPIFLLSLCVRFIQQVDLLAVKGLGGSTAIAGAFAGARNLALVTALFSSSFAPLLLATLTRLVREGDAEHARDIGRDSLRLPLLLLPVLAISAGMAGEIVRFSLGPGYAVANAYLPVLVLAGVAMSMFMVASSILIAADRASWAVAIIGALIPLTIAGHLAVVPRWAGVGAATVTAVALCSATALALVAVFRIWSIAPAVSTIVRSGVISIATFAVAILWPTEGWQIGAKLVVIGSAVAAALWFGGELDRREKELLISLVRRSRPGGDGGQPASRL